MRLVDILSWTTVGEVDLPAGRHAWISTPVVMEEGARIDYRIRLHGFQVRWRSQITVWDPPYRFVDRQIRGPYRVWIHEHRFHDEGDHTLVEDRVKYRAPGGELVQRLLVAPDLHRIFRYRHRRLVDRFGSAARTVGEPARSATREVSVLV